MTDEKPVPSAASFGELVSWQPATPRLRPLRLVISWIVSAASIWVAAEIVPGVGLESTGAAFIVAALIAVLNAVLPPVLAALRLPFMLVAGFLLVLLADALLLVIAHELLPGDIHVGSFGDALLAALVIAAVSVLLQAILGTNDDDEYSLKVTRRIAKRQGAQERTDVPGIIYLEIDGLALPVLRDALRDGTAPTMARWIADEGYQLAEWETDLSSQTGASQAGILLGSNEDISAFRWVEKERGVMMVCSSPVGLRRDRAPARDRGRAARRRGREPRQPALGRGRGDDPNGEPVGRGAQGEPGLPRLPGQRLQRHAGLRALPVGDRARADGGHPRRSAATSARGAIAAASTR